MQKQIVLKLNSLWQVIQCVTVKDAIIALMGEGDAYLAIDMQPKLKEDGTPDFANLEYILPVDWQTWMTLPVRPFDLYISTGKQKIRLPTIIVTRRYNKMPTLHEKFSKKGVMVRDGYVDQYSGEKLKPDESNLDHITPLDKGGKDSWENCVCTKIKTNSMKGNRFNHEVGLKLIRHPKAPKPIPKSATIKHVGHPSWMSFMPHKH